MRPQQLAGFAIRAEWGGPKQARAGFLDCYTPPVFDFEAWAAEVRDPAEQASEGSPEAGSQR